MEITPNILGSSFMNVELIADALGDITGLTLADFGCGSGIFSTLFAKRTGPSGIVTAIDVQTAPLENLSARAQTLGLANLRLVRADLEVLGSTKLADGSQDVVFIANILFQSVKKEAILQEAHRILRAGGRLLVVEWKKGGGGFGPADALRTDEATLERLITNVGFVLTSKPPAGAFHVAFLFHT
jgi:ubiquinone/menaquinone biosynthesis C-methylase UbiE